MKKHLFHAFLLLAALLAGSCNVHEWPGDIEPEPGPTPPSNVPVTLNLNFDTDLPLYQEVKWSRYGEANHDIRYSVLVYKGSRSKASQPEHEFVFTRSYSDNPDFTAQIELEDGQYEFYVWADYVDPGTTADKYYDTSEWEYIVLTDRQNHVGSNERRDAFRGYTSKAIVNAESVRESNTVNVDMLRPMARFEFFAADIDDFLSREARNRNSESRDMDLSDYIVVMQYNGFMPSAYNLFTDKPNDAWQNVSFQSEMNLTDRGASMGFDYVFVQNTTSVTMLRSEERRVGKECAC